MRRTLLGMVLYSAFYRHARVFPPPVLETTAFLHGPLSSVFRVREWRQEDEPEDQVPRPMIPTLRPK